MDKWKICIDSDTATPIDLAAIDLILAVNVGVPSIKYNALALSGYQGELDLTEVFGSQLLYEPRECSVFVMTKQQTVEGVPSIGKDSLDAFMSEYYGHRVRLLNVSESYMLIGRLTEGSIQGTGDNLKLTCKLIAEPFRYKATETERKNIIPLTTPSNQWATLTSGQTGATSTGFSASSDPAFSLSASSDSFYWVKPTDLVNCTVTIEDYEAPAYYGGAPKLRKIDSGLPFIPRYGTIRVGVRRIDYSKAASGTMFVGKYQPTSVLNSGKPVPIEVSNRATLQANANIYLLNNDSFALLDYGDDYAEYPQLMLDSGANKQLVFAESTSYNSAEMRNTDVVNLKWREGDV